MSESQKVAFLGILWRARGPLDNGVIRGVAHSGTYLDFD